MNNKMNFYPLTISEIRRETKDSVCLSFDIPDEHKEKFRFIQGQYLTLQSKIENPERGSDEEIRRSYSICSGIDDEQLQVGIKQVDGGLFSSYANQHLKIGDSLDVATPQGNFHTKLDPKQSKRYMCICAGSGITPILSIVKSVLSTEPNSHVTLLYGNKNSNTVMFKQELSHIKNRYMRRFQWLNILSTEQQDAEVLFGRLDNKKGGELQAKKLIDIPSTDEFFLCGPESMISAVSKGLRASGIDESNIHYELFFSSAEDAEAVVQKHHERAEKYHGENSVVSVKVSGRTISFDLSKDGENILDAAMNNGADLPFSCKGGVCATCKARVIEGEVDMDINHSLSAQEIEDGMVLSCQAHPTSDTLLIDFDQI